MQHWSPQFHIRPLVRLTVAANGARCVLDVSRAYCDANTPAMWAVPLLTHCVPACWCPTTASQNNQSQIICCGCGTLLFYPQVRHAAERCSSALVCTTDTVAPLQLQGASNVRCALCNNVTPVPPAGTEMAQLECGGCRTLLMYIRGASSVQCSVCNTVNLAMQANQIAHVNCGGCGITLMYAYGAQSIKCAVCNFVTQGSAGGSSGQGSSGGRVPQRPQMVVVENPPTVDDEGKLVSNMAVGVVAPK